MAEALTRVTDANYGEYLRAPASIVLFKIANCKNCDEFVPVVAQAAERHDGQIRFGMALLHIPGACREIKRKYRFESFPTIHFYRKGELVHLEDRKLPLEALETLIEKYLLS